jgi:hypothetical protein
MRFFQPRLRSFGAAILGFATLLLLIPQSAFSDEIVLMLDTTNRTFTINPITGQFSNGNGQSIVSIFDDGIENTTDPLIGSIVKTQGFFSGNPVLPLDPSGTMTDITTQIIANGSLVFSDLSLEALYSPASGEWVGLRTDVNLDNTINSPELDRFAALAGWTYMVDSSGLVHPDADKPEPKTLVLLGTGLLFLIGFGMIRRRAS